ncbi:hypothetical protein CDL12_19365 [Handroanthus impetiginosus]|uniref:Uncharacterized protein n=1 Tax=Handroanthus impetiginosus TaxID=429701 RepID=A0A2G9GRY5_9LAMI|nr:hypothetical protein CDL12_19365 [Handroanthus impetiginosus]
MHQLFCGLDIREIRLILINVLGNWRGELLKVRWNWHGQRAKIIMSSVCYTLLLNNGVIDLKIITWINIFVLEANVLSKLAEKRDYCAIRDWTKVSHLDEHFVS